MSKKKSLSLIIGIDVAKDSCDVCFLSQSEKEEHSGNYPKENYDALIKKIKKATPKIVVLEATGGYELHIVTRLFAEEIPCRVLNPLRARQFALSIGLLGKNDAIDARMLALYALRNNIEPMSAPDRKTLELRALLERRRQLVEHRAAEKKRSKLTTHEIASESIRNVIALLDKEIKELDSALADISKDDPELQRKEQILTSVPGVGEQTARTLLGSMPELGELNRAQAASLAGLAPFPRDSGKWRGKRSIRGGRFHVRKALYMATISAIRFNPLIAKLYARLRNAGKPVKVALTACMRKLLLLLNALIKKQTIFAK